MRPERKRTVNERMGGRDDTVGKERLQRHGGQAMKHALDAVPAAPILLPLAADAFVPWRAHEFPAKTFENDADRRQKTAPEVLGSAGVYCPAIGTTPGIPLALNLNLRNSNR